MATKECLLACTHKHMANTTGPPSSAACAVRSQLLREHNYKPIELPSQHMHTCHPCPLEGATGCRLPAMLWTWCNAWQQCVMAIFPSERDQINSRLQRAAPLDDESSRMILACKGVTTMTGSWNWSTPGRLQHVRGCSASHDPGR